MELNYYEKFTNFYHKNNRFKFTHKEIKPKSDKKKELYHINCIYTRKKICQCKFYGKNDHADNDLSSFLISLTNGDIDINDTSKCIQFSYKKKPEWESKETLDSLAMDQLKHTNYDRARDYLKSFEDVNLSIADYKEIEKSINDDKKICEKCGANLYGDNYHKGWKNENGDFVLLCFSCSKKYFSGASELKFDTKKEDMIPVNVTRTVQPAASHPVNVHIISNPAFRTEHQPQTGVPFHRSINFQVINTAKNEDYIGNKRLPDREGEMICSIPKCGKTGRKADFLLCMKCEKYFHPNCLDPPLILKYVNRFKWLCMNCKICQQCMNPKEKGNLLKCNTCDRTFHQQCYNVSALAMGNKLYCGDCITCKNCSKLLSIPALINLNDLLVVKGYRVCEDCWKYYKNKHYCPKCLKIYKQQNDNAKIYCNKCLNWYHTECEGLSPEEVKELTKAKYNYTCSVCKAT